MEAKIRHISDPTKYFNQKDGRKDGPEDGRKDRCACPADIGRAESRPTRGQSPGLPYPSCLSITAPSDSEW